MPMRQREDLAWQEVDGEGVLVDLVDSRMMGMNRAAYLVWSLAAENDSEALAAALTRTFDTDRETALRDVSAFLAELVARGLLVDA
jgi:hypothetical protein